MNSISILGNSHMNSVRGAKRDIEKAYPELTVHYFSAPRQMFETCYVDEDLTFGPRVPLTSQKGKPLDANGALRIDVGQTDAILIIGYGFNFQNFVDLVYETDILGHSPTDRPRQCSEAFFWEFVETTINEYLDKIVKNFGNLSNIVLMPAPYPSRGCLRSGKGYRKKLAHLFAHPEGRTIFESFMQRAEKAVEKRGFHLMRQPRKTVVGAFLTKRKYAGGVASARHDAVKIQDHMQMNKNFGLAVFDKFVQNYL